MFRQQNSLTSWNTFHLNAQAAGIFVLRDVETLCKRWQESQRQQLPTLILGEGSNVLFIEDFHGHVLINRICDIKIKETEHSWHLHIGAGENWHELVAFCLKKDIAGLENLALIPGCAGSAPIQNIGAYGVEFQEVCEYVSIVHLPTGKQMRLNVDECAFGYRDSVFKHHYRDEYAIVAIGLKLDKLWRPVLTYGDLVKLDPESVTPRQIFNSVCQMRRSKLPDPALKGNAGSFFKNPVIDRAKADEMLMMYPKMPSYPQGDGKVKLAAGWLIDQCDLRGFRIGGAMVHCQQALVLINEEHASGNDVVALARIVRQRVGEKFDIWLEPEVRFIGARGEMDAVREIS
ncbi:UDP-N-acetylmuramate dehydrogenase [Izhakiella capsodis]|uniref:UDP-N-acetylenolpyruvoylglucosamine reductase n=1 Tax=Izhakiella capsodis TaxID=1367852 RepID=A0A1I5BU16_9GAMM|nr:UDP-N-acetylmuramate dehydrogenase [Izhakiella capsodis]SFN78200.1 UDP-N-acetylmuramate dehydrogenase [Izhakiella capsodis]